MRSVRPGRVVSIHVESDNNDTTLSLRMIRDTGYVFLPPEPAADDVPPDLRQGLAEWLATADLPAP